MSTATSPRRPTKLLLSVLFAAMLAACGGGEDSPSGPTSAQQGADTQSSLGGSLRGASAYGGVPAYEPVGSDMQATCPHSKADDAWLDRRLGCISHTAGFDAGSPVADQDVTVRITQWVFHHNGENAIDNTTGSDQATAFNSLVCFRNLASAGLSKAGVVNLLTQAFRLEAEAANSGDGVQTHLDVSRPTVATCDPQEHAVIIDAATGQVDSVHFEATSHVWTLIGPNGVVRSY